MVGNTGQRQTASYLGRDEGPAHGGNDRRARRTKAKKKKRWKKQTERKKENKLQGEQNYMCNNK
jgi:hypothetical protein